MSSLLRPVVLDSCGGLRERRRSSVHSAIAVPRLFAASPLEECAIFDEKDAAELKRTIAQPSQVFGAPNLPTLAHFQLPNNSKNSHSLPAIYADDASKAPNLERLRWRLASAFFAYFLCGWGDGVTGTVLPRSTLGSVSSIFFMIGTMLLESIVNQLGRFDPSKNTWSWVPQMTLFRHIFARDRSKKDSAFSPSQARFLSLLVSSTLHAMFFVVMGIARGGFWVIFFAYALAAFSRSILTSSRRSVDCFNRNEYFAYGSPQSIGYAYGLWSFGGTISPLVCQSLMAVGVPWNHFYLGSLVLSASNTTFLVLTYKPTPTESLRDCEDARALNTQRRTSDSVSSIKGSIEHYSPSESPIEKSVSKDSKNLLLTLRQPFQWAVCLFGLLYCGCETTTQALMVSYLLGVRHANPNTVGLTPVHRKFVILGCMRCFVDANPDFGRQLERGECFLDWNDWVSGASQRYSALGDTDDQHGINLTIVS
ncbi:hypothetical protein BJ912DRAFT_920416 [Pholiota molesta]|nr:hypothetical protein BJ912DRAFT_920416 [Pholiota molesta]